MEQFYVIGGDNFLRGRISKLWGEVFHESGMRWSQRVDKQLWVSDLVAALLHYSHSLWKFRCSFINGGTAEESDKLRLHALQKEVSKAYEDFHTDPFFVSHRSHVSSQFP